MEIVEYDTIMINKANRPVVVEKVMVMETSHAFVHQLNEPIYTQQSDLSTVRSHDATSGYARSQLNIITGHIEHICTHQNKR